MKQPEQPEILELRKSGLTGLTFSHDPLLPSSASCWESEMDLMILLAGISLAVNLPLMLLLGD